jgi:hypothetical protein
MGAIRLSLILGIIIVSIIVITSTSASKYSSKRDQSTRLNERIDCYPDAISSFANYSKESCLARNCLFDDGANSGAVQCYLSPNYGYILQGNAEQITNGLRLRLKRNQAVPSMFKQPIENVLLEVQYYTNDILRFKLYDADNQRYEVRRKRN